MQVYSQPCLLKVSQKDISRFNINGQEAKVYLRVDTCFPARSYLVFLVSFSWFKPDHGPCCTSSYFPVTFFPESRSPFSQGLSPVPVCWPLSVDAVSSLLDGSDSSSLNTYNPKYVSSESYSRQTSQHNVYSHHYDPLVCCSI